MMECIFYRDEFKYQLAVEYSVKTPIVGESVVEEYFTLYPDGTLLVNKGYAWDGASGPTFDSASSMRPSLVHDVFCQMMRNRNISYDLWQDKINQLFRTMCIEDGMIPLRAYIWYLGVEFGDAGNPSKGLDRIIKQAP